MKHLKGNLSFNIISLGVFFIFLLILLNQKDINLLNLVFGIDTMHPCFADIRTITGYNESIQSGHNPFIENPGDPWQRPMNYPPIWAYFAEIANLSHSDAYLFGFANITLYILGLLLFLNNIQKEKSLNIALWLTLFSPASMLVMERGNIDMIVFFLISLSIIFSASVYPFTSLILIASILKVFPIIALVEFKDRLKDKKVLSVLLIAITVFSLYVLIYFDYFVLIRKGTPNPIGFAYGINVLWMAAESKWGSTAGVICRILTYGYFIVLAIFLLKTYRKPSLKLLSESNDYALCGFRMGTLIYIFTFSLNNNWSYRLIFLIFTIPQLYIWSLKSPFRRIKIAATLGLFAIVYNLWIPVFYRAFEAKSLMLSIFSTWFLFTLLSYFYAVSEKKDDSFF